MLALHGDTLLVSAFKPAGEGGDYVLRLLNPGSDVARGRVSVGFDLTTVRPARLDEQLWPGQLTLEGPRPIQVAVQAHQLLTLLLSARTEPATSV